MRSGDVRRLWPHKDTPKGKAMTQLPFFSGAYDYDHCATCGDLHKTDGLDEAGNCSACSPYTTDTDDDSDDPTSVDWRPDAETMSLYRAVAPSAAMIAREHRAAERARQRRADEESAAANEEARQMRDAESRY
jgi:hypothetical protein